MENKITAKNSLNTVSALFRVEKIKEIISKNDWVWQALVVFAILTLISSSWFFGFLGFAAIATNSLLKDKKYLKHIGLAFLVVPIFFYIGFHELSADELRETYLIPSKFLYTISLFIFFYLRKKWNKNSSKKEWTGNALLPFALYFIIEFLQKNFRIMIIGFLKMQNILHYGHLYGLLVIIATVSFFHLFFSKKISWYIATGIYGLFGIVNFFVVAYTSQGFIPSDFKNALTGFGCLGSQALKSEDIIRLIAGVLFIAAIIIAITLIYKNEKKDTRKIGQRASVLTMILILIFMSWMTCSWFKSNLLLFNSHSKYGFVTNFIVNLDNGIKFPSGLEEYQFADEDNDVDFMPNVIVVMNEAFSDLNGVFNLEGEENLRYFNSLKEKYPSGIAYSSVKGNNTCSSEWESLSGVSTALTNTKGAVVYQDNCKFMNSLVNVFNRRGYYTVGVHPYYDFGYNRDKMYDALGFQEKVFMDEFGDNPEKKRQYITDKANYLKVIDLYEQNNDKPFFCFNITMQNHGGYKQETKDVVPYKTTPYDDVNRYLSLVNDADEMLKTLIGYFEKVKEPTIILFFGDHQPAIEDSFYETYMNTEYSELTVEQLKSVYQVPYLIWANYELNEDAAPEEVSINYLSSVLFDVGNIPSTTWLDMLRDFREEWPIVTVNFAEDKEGNLFSTSEVKTNEILAEYSMRSYSILKGENDD